MHPSLIAAAAVERHADLLREADRSRRLRSARVVRARRLPELLGRVRTELARLGALRPHAVPTPSACCA
ncbi:MAG: hypothetical protein ACTHOK_11780 [Nocardioidaceae bacterium]